MRTMVARLQTVADPVRLVGRPPLPDRLPGLGPLSGIATGLEASFTDANLFVRRPPPFDERVPRISSSTTRSFDFVRFWLAKLGPLFRSAWE